MAQVDIVMPLYNKAETVRRAIRSIQHQSVTDWRLIVVDDGSTDQGSDIVAALDDERITIIRQDNQGPGAARNRGIALAESEFLSFLDADDEWYPWFLKNSLKAIQENDVAMVVSMYYLWPQKQDMTEFWASRNVRAGVYSLQGNENPAWVNKMRSVVKVLNFVARRETVHKYDGFYEKNRCLAGEDTTLFLRILFGENFMVIGPPAARRHSESGELGIYSKQARPVPPYLLDPHEVMRYCPEKNQALLQKVLDYMAVTAARAQARSGKKNDAITLVDRFPGSKSFKGLYYRCRYEIAFSRCLPYWIKFKMMFSTPVKALLNCLAKSKANQQEPPLMPYEK